MSADLRAVQTWNLPSQSLASALLELGRQTDLQISFPPDAVRGKQSPALQGKLTPLDALNELLKGSGLAASSGGQGVILVNVNRYAAYVEQLDMIPVDGNAILDPAVYRREDIDNLPTSNRDLSSLLSTHPAVRIDNAANGSVNRGSLTVDDMSFHGASPYQNLFQIDGMDATSNIDPANKNVNLQIGNIPSNTQAYFVDTALLEQVRVYDSLVPAEYGRFNGGVVDARLRRPTGTNSLKVDYRWNTSGMTEQKIAVRDQRNFDLGAPGFTPEWRKQFMSALGEYNFSKDLGMLLNVSRRESTIQRVGMTIDETGAAVQETRRSEDRIDSGVAKLSAKLATATFADLTLKFSDRQEDGIAATFRDTRWTYAHKAYGLAGNLEHGFAHGKLTVQAGYDTFIDNRVSNANGFVTHTFDADRTRQYTSGGYGKEDKTRDSWTLKTRVDLDRLETGAVRHYPYAGFDLQRVTAGFQRHEDAYSAILRYPVNGAPRYRSYNLYHAGVVDLDYANYGAYINDRIEWRRAALTVGARYDKETFIGNGNLAPRSRLDWDVAGNGQTRLSAGWNRYYGDSILDIGLREEISRLKQLIYNVQGIAVPNGWASAERTRYGDLRTPYHDEWALSLTQRLGGVVTKLSAVRRNGRDQVKRQGSGNDANPYLYTNDGVERANTYSLTMQNGIPWRSLRADWRVTAALSYGRVRSNGNAVTGYDENIGNSADEIIYNGSRVRRVDRPGVAFNRPSQASLGLTGIWHEAGVTWNNFLRWTGSRNEIAYIGASPAPARLEMYADTRLPAYWTLDTRVAWRPVFARHLEMSIEVLNIFNKQPVIVPTRPRVASDESTYRVGREIWLAAGYRF